jgi:hypothetical protein
MNERIGQLAEQAGLLGPSSRVGNSHQATEKFAELIIRECASVIAEHYDASEPWITPKTLLYHFGVEE